jgi:hypothetical protein
MARLGFGQHRGRGRSPFRNKEGRREEKSSLSLFLLHFSAALQAAVLATIGQKSVNQKVTGALTRYFHKWIVELKPQTP